jgi:adenylate cyclase
MGGIEAIRLCLGLLIPPLILQHAIGIRLAWSYYGVHRIYRNVLLNIAQLQIYTWRQFAVFCIAWLHGCIGLYLYLRVKRGFRNYAPFLLTFAVLLPFLAALGVIQGAREVAEKIRLDPQWFAELRSIGQGANKPLNEALREVVLWLWIAYGGALALVFVARGVRALVERHRGNVQIRYPDGRTVRVPVGLSVLDASRRAGIPHASVCGGRARCSTCRVRVLSSLDRLPEPSFAEVRALARIGRDRAVRLACQLKPVGDISILPLLPPDIGSRELHRVAQGELGGERFLAILFVDIRQSTGLVEKRLPYDVLFLLNRFFEAVGSGILAAGGTPNQFSGDGVMAIFGVESSAEEACQQALLAARMIDRQLAEMNRTLSEELPEPITIGIGIHAGEVIFGTVGYREHSTLTAIGDVVHVASRLQELTKEYACQLVVSDLVGRMAGVDLADFPMHEIQLRGRHAPLAIRVVDTAAALGWIASGATRQSDTASAVA